MNRNLIIVVIGVVVLGVILLVAFSLKGGGIHLTSSPPSFQKGSAAEAPQNLVSTMPSDAPKGSTLSIQTQGGVVTVKNFYLTAAGYWPEADAIAVEENPNYTIWYYRASGSFEIAVASTGTADDEKAAETKLASDLGVDRKTFCELSISASFLPGGDAAYKQDLPISTCVNAF